MLLLVQLLLLLKKLAQVCQVGRQQALHLLLLLLLLLERSQTLCQVLRRHASRRTLRHGQAGTQPAEEKDQALDGTSP